MWDRVQKTTYNKEYYQENKHKWQKYYADNPEKYHAANKKQFNKVKEKLFEVFGSACVKCGFADKRALQLDHKNGGGGVAQKRIMGTLGVWKSALENPEDFQMLCANCNWIKRAENNENARRILN